MEYVSAILFALFVVLSVADIYLTETLLSKDQGTEANPVMRYFINRFGRINALIGVKGIVALFLFILFWFAGDWWGYALALLIVDGFMTYVIKNNYDIYVEANKK